MEKPVFERFPVLISLIPIFLVAATFLAMALSACSNRRATPPDEAKGNHTHSDLWEVTVIAENLEAPWDVAFTPDDRRFITERDRAVLSELHQDGTRTEVRRFNVDSTAEGGLMGLTASPNFQDDGWLYVYYTSDRDNRIVRLQTQGAADAPTETVLTGIPRAAIHNGGRIEFGPDGMLYAATGDAANTDLAQDPSSLAGKILRMTPRGDVPEDNPTPDSLVYAMGLRNVQGLAWSQAGHLFVTEFGPDRDDAIYRIQPGENYGWPQVTGFAEHEGFKDPVIVRQPSEASWSGATFLVDGAIPGWEGDLFVAALRGNRLWRFELGPDGQEQESEELFVNEFGRLRHVTQAPDGSLWVLTNNRDGRGSPRGNDDRILRIGPK